MTPAATGAWAYPIATLARVAGVCRPKDGIHG